MSSPDPTDPTDPTDPVFKDNLGFITKSRGKVKNGMVVSVKGNCLFK